MKIEWLYEAQTEFHDLILFYKSNVGSAYAKKFSDMILSSVRQLKDFPESGVLREDLLIGQYGFRALFIDKYVCIYKIEDSTVYIYHLADARSNYIYNIFGLEPYSE